MSPAPHNKSLIRRTLWCGLASSILLHVGLLAVMLFGTVRTWLAERPLLMTQATYRTERAPSEPRDATFATIVINDDDPAPIGIQQQLDASLVATEQLSEAERIDALDDATKRLSRISSDASLNDVAQRLQSWLGLTPRADRPVVADKAADAAADSENEESREVDLAATTLAAEEKPFDFETAQLHDVKRIDVPDGRPQYVCVLLDARGRTMEVPLSEAEGEPIYTLMEKIKASPLLETIYRQLAMPMLDQLVRAERATSTAAAKVHAEQPEATDPASADSPSLSVAQ